MIPKPSILLIKQSSRDWAISSASRVKVLFSAYSRLRPIVLLFWRELTAMVS